MIFYEKKFYLSQVVWQMCESVSAPGTKYEVKRAVSLD